MRFCISIPSVVLLAVVVTGCVSTVTLPPPPRPYAYWLDTLGEPRQIRVHHLKIDLTNVDVLVGVNPDPDGAGVAESQLSMPMSMVRRYGCDAAVNANAFAAIPDSPGKQPKGWRPRQPVDIVGLAVEQGIVRSAPQPQYIAFWVDYLGKPHIGNPASADGVRDGCAGFGWLVRNGRIAAAGTDIHPRTALGLDAAGQVMWLVVVDGRQRNYSEGMSTPELARYMRSLGCWNAVNLDGGGSSIMMVADREGVPEVVNRPSTRVGGFSIHRPVPVIVGIRTKR